MFPSLSLKMQMKPSLKVILAGKYLRATCDEIDGMLSQEIVANPFLECAHPVHGFELSLTHLERIQRNEGRKQSSSTRQPTSTSDNEWSDPFEKYASREFALENLVQQIRMVSDGACRETSVNLLNYLDKHGYLSLNEPALALELGVSLEIVHAAILVLHELEPPGIGAYNIRHCFLIQCSHLNQQGFDCAIPRKISS